jgi:hypothetical protein
MGCDLAGYDFRRSRDSHVVLGLTISHQCSGSARIGDFYCVSKHLLFACLQIVVQHESDLQHICPRPGSLTELNKVLNL